MSEQLDMAAVAARLGLQKRTVARYRQRPSLNFPAPDGETVINKVARPWWLPETIDAWKASRPGPGYWGPHPERTSSDNHR